MKRIYEVNIMAHAARTLHISADTADEAAKLAETMYKNSNAIDLDNEMVVSIEAVSLSDDDYCDRRVIVDPEDGTSSTIPDTHGMCNDCVLYAIFNSISIPDNGGNNSASC